MNKKQDMHSADIIAAIKKRKGSLAAISREAGLSSGTLANALKKPWPKGEFIIAAALDLHPSEIWPSRYFDTQGHLLARDKLIRRARKNSIPAESNNLAEYPDKELNPD